MIAPKGSDDWRDDHGDLAVGETEEGGGAALENVGVWALGFPGKRVEGGKRGNAAGGAGENAGEETQRFCQRFCAAIGVRNKKGGTPELVREIGGHEGFGDVVKTGKRNMLRAGAQGCQRALHCGMAKNGLQSFANGGKYHGRRSGIRARGGSAFANLSQ